MVLRDDPFFNRSVATAVSDKFSKPGADNAFRKVKTTTITSKPSNFRRIFSSDNDDNSNGTKRLKQAHEYINSLEVEQNRVKSAYNHSPQSSNVPNDDESIDCSDNETNAQEIDRSLIHERLQRDALSQYKKLYISFSDSLSRTKELSAFILSKKISGMPLTSCSWSTSDIFYTSSKDGIVQQWSITSNSIEKSKKFQLPDRQKIPLYTLALSPNNEYVVAGGKGGILYIWKVQDCKLVKNLKHHKGNITGLSFRKPNPHSMKVFVEKSSTNSSEPMTLYSCSDDRSVKIWDIDQLAYADTLFGHEDAIVGIDSLSKERCVTCGARDRSLHIWKIVESSQLVFKADDLESSIDAVIMLDEEHFISGSENGTLSVWHIGRKRPVIQVKQAHKCGIMSLATIPMSDVVVSGSCDGKIHFWRVSNRYSILELLFSISVSGFINDMSLSFYTTSEGEKQLGKGSMRLLICVSKEPRLGRWKVDNTICNSILVYGWNLI